jgi:hypothetical protein
MHENPDNQLRQTVKAVCSKSYDYKNNLTREKLKKIFALSM